MDAPANSVDRTIYNWDYKNQNTRIELPAGEVVTYVYNPRLRRVKTETATGTTNFVWEWDNTLTEYDDLGATQARYTTGIKES